MAPRMRFGGILTAAAALLLCLKVAMVVHSSILVLNMPAALESARGGGGSGALDATGGVPPSSAASAGHREKLQSSSCCHPQCGGYKDGSYMCICCTKHLREEDRADQAHARGGGAGGGAKQDARASPHMGGSSAGDSAAEGQVGEGHNARDEGGDREDQRDDAAQAHGDGGGHVAATNPQGRYGVFAGMAGPAGGTTCCHASCMGVKNIADYRCGCCTGSAQAAAAAVQGHGEGQEGHALGGSSSGSHARPQARGGGGAHAHDQDTEEGLEAEAAPAADAHRHQRDATSSPRAGHEGTGRRGDSEGRDDRASWAQRRVGGEARGGGDDRAPQAAAAAEQRGATDAFGGGTNQVFRDTHSEGGVLRSRRERHGRRQHGGGGRQGLLAEYEALKAKGLAEAEGGKGGEKKERRPLSWDKSWWEPKAWVLWFFSGPSLTGLIFALNAMTQGWQCGLIYVAILTPLDVMTYYFDLYAYDEGDLLWIEFALALVLNGLLCACLLPAYAASQMMNDDRRNMGAGYGYGGGMSYQDLPYGGLYGATGAGSGFNPFQGQGQSTGYNGGYGVRTERTQLV